MRFRTTGLNWPAARKAVVSVPAWSATTFAQDSGTLPDLRQALLPIKLPRVAVPSLA